MYDASTHQTVAKDGIDLKEEQETYLRPVHLNLLARFIRHRTLFFFHDKTTSAGLSTVKTISRTTP